VALSRERFLNQQVTSEPKQNNAFGDFVTGLQQSIDRGILPDYMESRAGGTPTRGLKGLVDPRNLPENAIDAAKLAGEGIAGVVGGTAGAATGGALGSGVPIIGTGVGAGLGSITGAGAATGAAKRVMDEASIQYAKSRNLIEDEEAPTFREKAKNEARWAGATGAIGQGLGDWLAAKVSRSVLKGSGRVSTAVGETTANEAYDAVAKNVDPDNIANNFVNKAKAEAEEKLLDVKQGYKDINGKYDWRNASDLAFKKSKPPAEKVNFLKSTEESLEGAQDLTSVYKKLPPGSHAQKRIKKIIGADKPVKGVDGKIDKKATKKLIDRSVKNVTDIEMEAVYRTLAEEAKDAKLFSRSSSLDGLVEKVNKEFIPQTEFAKPHSEYNAFKETYSGEKGLEDLLDLPYSEGASKTPNKLPSTRSKTLFSMGEGGLPIESRTKLGKLAKSESTKEVAPKSSEMAKAFLAKQLANKGETSPFGYAVNATKESREAAGEVMDVYRHVQDTGKFDPSGAVHNLENFLAPIDKLKNVDVRQVPSSPSITNINSETINKLVNNPTEEFRKIADALGIDPNHTKAIRELAAQYSEYQRLYKNSEKVFGNPSLSIGNVKFETGGISPKDARAWLYGSKFGPSAAGAGLRSGTEDVRN
jgi:hypothetical protein